MKNFYILIIIIFLGLVTCKKEEIINKNVISAKNRIDSFSVTYQSKDTTYIINKVIQTTDSGYVLIGGVHSNFSYTFDFMLKLDSLGKKKWTFFNEKDSSTKGVIDIAITDIGNYLIYRDQDFDIPYTIEVSPNGQMLAQYKMFGGINGTCLIKSSNEYLVYGGTAASGTMALQSFTQSGFINWTKTYESEPNGISISKSNDNNFLIIGGGNYSGDGKYLKKIDNKGNIIWEKNYKGYLVKSLSKGGFIIINAINFKSNSIVEFDDNGNEIRTKKYDMDRKSYFNGTLNFFELPNSKYILTYTVENFLHILYLDENYDEFYPEKILLVSLSDKFAITKTIDNGLLIVKSIENSPNSNAKMEIMKLPNRFK